MRDSNFIKADHYSAAGTPRWAQAIPALPGPLAKFWPNADTGKVRAETTEVETALDQEMAEGEGEPTPKVEPSGQYTGDLVKVAR